MTCTENTFYLETLIQIHMILDPLYICICECVLCVPVYGCVHTWMCLFICVPVCVYIQVYGCLYIWVFIHMSVFAGAWVCYIVSVHMCAYVQVRAYIQVYGCVDTWVHVCALLWVHMYVCGGAYIYSDVWMCA